MSQSLPKEITVPIELLTKEQLIEILLKTKKKESRKKATKKKATTAERRARSFVLTGDECNHKKNELVVYDCKNKTVDVLFRIKLSKKLAETPFTSHRGRPTEDLTSRPRGYIAFIRCVDPETLAEILSKVPKKELSRFKTFIMRAHRSDVWNDARLHRIGQTACDRALEVIGQ